ncbi:hypothetical protein GGX14DRAFT_532323 [Mycena pura]|uniref:Uncharacterized protein n=1 Tax=Mycena pura TaxID=153505 RepID=A0AAD6YL84_9AGAR|nr:hypothetical protein GGX14DRAFT_532323 [Mycena pura]
MVGSHALQLRQAKLSFPSVYPLVGVSSDAQSTSAHRLEAVRHRRWGDEVVAEAPWIIDRIDYVAHDEVQYAAVGRADVYELCKSQGKFIPTQRVSTSELLERIVSGYRHQVFDDKLEEMVERWGIRKAEGSDYDESSRVGTGCLEEYGPRPPIGLIF